VGNISKAARIYIARLRLSVKQTKKEERRKHVPEFVTYRDMTIL
jgi:hypothetical protein